MRSTYPGSTFTQPALARLAGLTLLLLLTLTGPGVALAIPATDRLYGPTEVPQDLSAAEWAEITGQIQHGYYQVRPVEGGYRASNPGQQWQTRFDGAGFRIRPDAGGWDWGLALRSYGYPGAERVVAAKAQVSAAGQRVIYRWDENLSEWYENDERGLEHGFELQ